eukprot:g604.t1
MNMIASLYLRHSHAVLRYSVARRLASATAVEVEIAPPDIAAAAATEGAEATRQVDAFGISDETAGRLRARGIDNLFPVQAATFHALRHERQDLVCRSLTGSGKTLAFALPIVESLLAEDGDANEHGGRDRQRRRQGHGRLPRALVLAPTRELAGQVAAEFVRVAPRLRCAVVYGGVSFGEQVRELRQGVDVVCATPGRMLDHLERGTIDLRNVNALCIDEADMMLQIGMKEDVEEILRAVPRAQDDDEDGGAGTPSRLHCSLWSATVPQWVHGMAKRFMNAPRFIDMAAAPSGAAGGMDLQTDMRRAGASTRSAALNPDVRIVAVAARRAHRSEILSRIVTLHAAGRLENFISGRAGAGAGDDTGAGVGADGSEGAADAGAGTSTSLASGDQMEPPRALIFTDTKAEVEVLAQALRSGGRGGGGSGAGATDTGEVRPLHGDMPQASREAALRVFKGGRDPDLFRNGRGGMSSRERREARRQLQRSGPSQARTLVATDVAARGLDIPAVDLVVHYRLPKELTARGSRKAADKTDTFVHRSGRTGRAGRPGVSLVLYDPTDSGDVSALENLGQSFGQSLAIVQAPTADMMMPLTLASATTAMDGVSQAAAALFEPEARRLIAQADSKLDDADDAGDIGVVNTLSRALALLAGTRSKPLTYSALGAQAGYCTVRVEQHEGNARLTRIG